MKKQLLLTFDYELFLGPKSGQASSCLLNPTNALLNIMRPHGVKAIFFVDTAYLYTLEKYSKQYENCKNDLRIVSDQIQNIVREGHYVFPHIHPHWLDAKYLPDIHEFVLKDVRRYRFHSLDKQDRQLLFGESMRIISNIIHPEFPEYKINGYRAGGWSIQPFEDIKPFFKSFGIEYDFSVMRGAYQFSNAQYFDFSDSPAKPIYNFSDDVVKENKGGEFTQLSSSVIKLSPYIKMGDRILQKVLFKFVNDHTYGKGVGQQPKALRDLSPRSLKGHPSKDRSHEPVAVELLSVVKLQNYLNFFREENYMHFVSHPKMVSNHNLSMLDQFLKIVFHDYSIETDFLKIAELYKK